METSLALDFRVNPKESCPSLSKAFMIYDAFKEPDISIQHCQTEQQAADVFTKCWEVHKWKTALDIIGIFDPSEDP